MSGVKESEEWLVSLHKGSEKWLVSLRNGSEKSANLKVKGVKIELFSFCAAFPNMVSFTYQLHISDTVLNHLSSRPVYFNGFSLTDFEYTILQNSQGKVFSSKLLPSLASTQLNFNFNFEAEIALFSDNTATHPATQPGKSCIA